MFYAFTYFTGALGRCRGNLLGLVVVAVGEGHDLPITPTDFLKGPNSFCMIILNYFLPLYDAILSVSA